jgi:uncharacterized protein (DUF4415 family)
MIGDRPRRPHEPRRSQDARQTAEKAFKAVTTKPVDAPPAVKAPAPIPGLREQVTLRIDQDVLDRFRAAGPGWQERINTALRKAIER